MAHVSDSWTRHDGLVTEPTATDTSAPSEATGVGGEGPIVVGIDGSPESQRGLVFAADLAQRLGIELVVVHAFGLLGALETWTTPVAERERETIEVMESTWCASLRERTGLRWRMECVQGHAVAGILRTADETDAAFIVVGSHGAGNSQTPLLGSTSHDVVRNSHRPVIVIPPPDNHPHRRGGAGAMGVGITDR
jgi:nucleotide-binding universal stress UspA family protein